MPMAGGNVAANAPACAQKERQCCEGVVHLGRNRYLCTVKKNKKEADSSPLVDTNLIDNNSTNKQQQQL